MSSRTRITIVVAWPTAVFAGVIDPTHRKGHWELGSVEAALYESQKPPDASDVFRLWAEHAKTMIQACQRRGESDLVASWMYQHAALVPDMADVYRDTS